MAVCRAAQSTEVHVMFPMVSTVEEVTWTRGQLAEAARRTTGDVPPGLKVGIMIEVPAAALRVEHLAAGLDFVSVGTNDLAQYTLAAERGNAQVADLVDPLDPAVLGLVDRVCRKVPEGVEVAVCGQLASDLDGVVLLAGLGVRELSATAASVPMVKARLRDLDVLAANALAAEALTLSSAAAVRRLLSSETTRLRVGG
jgi:phosphocarrier protein FPr